MAVEIAVRSKVKFTDRSFVLYYMRMAAIYTSHQLTGICYIGTGTGLAGPAMARPFSAEVETKVCVQLLCGLVPRLNYCSKIRQSTYVNAHARTCPETAKNS